MAAPISVASGAATDAGLRRRINEDSYIASAPVFLVADGMGGHDAGELASAAVIAEFARLGGLPSVSVDTVHATLGQARRAVAQLPLGERASAGTTLTGVLIAEVEGEGYWLAVNLGDSRTYRLSEGELEQISIDHSMVQELVDSGKMDAAAAARDSRRNVITRAIGGGSDADADYWLLPAEEGDRILVCSDGLSNEIDDEGLRQILCAEVDPQAAATRLVHEAMVRGGRDNITALVVDAVRVNSRGENGRVHATAPARSFSDDLDADTLPRARARKDA